MPENAKLKSTDRDKLNERVGINAKDRSDRSYYYDDAHGYQEYDPDSDEENEESDDSENDSD